MYELAKTSLNNLGNEIRSAERRSQEGCSNDRLDDFDTENHVPRQQANNANIMDNA